MKLALQSVKRLFHNTLRFYGKVFKDVGGGLSRLLPQSNFILQSKVIRNFDIVLKMEYEEELGAVTSVYFKDSWVNHVGGNLHGYTVHQ